jgi:hypothetical protein
VHPLDYGDVIRRIRLAAAEAFVIGVRTIGTTLSAVVADTIRQLGIPAQRTTVRPTGFPYNRVCSFTPEQRFRIGGALARNAVFVVCDEGPGRSGSSLLSIAEALEGENVPRHRILILCSHEPDVGELCAPNAAQRWERYRSEATGITKRLPPDTGEFIGAGDWRRRFIAGRRSWPATWLQMERLKYLSRAGLGLWKFDGHGPYGEEVRARQQALAGSGFGAAYLWTSHGFMKQGLVSGRVGEREDLTSDLLIRMAQYCVWRSQHLPAGNIDLDATQSMVRVNFEREFRRAPSDFALPVERPTICDGRMQPHEWSVCDRGGWIKLDAATHGDDHFFPGPCDIAWDLAGIIVEWSLERSAREYLLAAYQRCSGDKISQRIACYEVAYATFRMAWSAMAAAAVGESDDKGRLLRDYERYRGVAVAIDCASAGQLALHGARL